MTETIETLGKILKGDEQRDAIHVAVLPVTVAAKYLYRAEPVKFVYGTSDQVIRAEVDYGDTAVGVIDPFLHDDVKEGDRVWLFLYPGTITSLRHEWTHPLVDSPPQAKNASETWLRGFAQKWNFDWDEMLSGALDGDYVTARGIDLHGAKELAEGDEVRFWHHMEVLTGRVFDEAHRAGFIWSCSC